MTLKAFILALPEEGWQLHQEVLVRRKATNKGQKHFDCPITYLFGKKSAELPYAEIVAKRYLDYPVIGRIVDAADNDINTPTIGRIRRAILNHCGLKEQE